MTEWSASVLRQVVPRLTPVPFAERAAILAGPSATPHHRAHFDRLAALRQIEAAGMASRQSIAGAARIAFWNVERLRHIDAIADTLRAIDADVTLLCEVDRGMARSGNADRIADLAGRLDKSYLYAVEFVELGLGDRNEQRIHAGEVNADGLHGAALFSDARMTEPFLIRIDARGDWFDGERGERRVGGTIALGAGLVVSGRPVLMVSVHLESHCDPAVRAGDMQHLLGLIETIALPAASCSAATSTPRPRSLANGRPTARPGWRSWRASRNA